MPPADTGASVIDRAAASPQSSTDSSPSAAPDPESGKLRPGGPGYRRMSFALFAAGIATFALLYSTQALLPAISTGLGVSPDQASWTVSAATFGLALGMIPLSAVSERFGLAAR